MKKKKNQSRILSLLLAMALLVTGIPIPVQASNKMLCKNL